MGNPGPGGYAALLVFKDKSREVSGGFRKTTNNRMELMAAIAGMETLRYPCKVTLWTDSKYLADSMRLGWAKSWKSKGWKVKSGDRAKNIDLWIRILELCDKHQVEFMWVKGHDGHEENERCDALSVEAAKRADLPIDEPYEQELV